MVEECGETKTGKCDKRPLSVVNPLCWTFSSSLYLISFILHHHGFKHTCKLSKIPFFLFSELSAKQTRRVTRTTRPIVLKDENANANANARSRIVTRSKPPSLSNPTTQASVLSRITGPAATTRAKVVAKDPQMDDPAAQGKRKRSTLGEVTVNKPKVRGATTDKGKGKEDAMAMPPPSKFAGVVIKSKSAATTAAPLSRQALRTVTAPTRRPDLAPKRTTRSSAATNQVLTSTKEEQKAALHVDAMAIDPPDLHAPPRHVHGHSRKPTSLATIVRQTSAAKEEPERDEAEVEANRVFKKRRTSSEDPEECEKQVDDFDPEDQIRGIAEKELQKHLHDIEREVEADPNGDEWEDLDAEDADDPMMVSEYANEIFDYLKVAEVCFPCSTLLYKH
jgi:G2/mitotic-specific cyclin 2